MSPKFKARLYYAFLGCILLAISIFLFVMGSNITTVTNELRNTCTSETVGKLHRVDTDYSEEDTMYRGEYTYVVDGVDYEAVGNGWSTVKPYPGTEVTVCYDPSYPYTYYIKGDMPLNAPVFIISVVFGLVGILFVTVGVIRPGKLIVNGKVVYDPATGEGYTKSIYEV